MTGKHIQRLDKFLADMEIGTRKEVKKYIKGGRVRVDDVIAASPEQKVDPSVQKVCFDEHPVIYVTNVYYMMNKPAGVLSATEDRRQQTVLDLFPDDYYTKDVFPVGRLDKDTTGLLVLTNDGALAHQVLSPKKHVPKCYEAEIKGKVTEEDVTAFAEGLVMDEDWTTLPATLTILRSDEISQIRVVIYEGKYHQVKRMFETVGKEVLTLKRLSMGALSLDPALMEGQVRVMTPDEVEALRKRG